MLGHSLRAGCLERRHRLDEARSSAQRALELDPANVSAHLVQAEIERRDKDFDAADRRLTALLARDDVGPTDRADALQKHGTVLDALGRHDDAWAALAAHGAAMQSDAEVRRVDRRLWYRRIEHYGRALTPEVAERWAAHDDDDGVATPAFLVGFARSGTTMLEQVLAAHPNVVTSGERPVIRNTKRRLAALRPGREDLIAMLESLTPDERRTLRGGFWEEAEDLTGESLSGRTFVHKQPMNFIDIGFINVLFPKAKVLFVERDPRDVCVSCLLQSFKINPVNVHFLTAEHTVAMYAAAMLSKSLREEVVAEQVGGKAPIQTLRGACRLRQHHADVVDEHMHLVDRRGQLQHAGHGRQIGGVRHYRARGSGSQLVEQTLVARDGDDASPLLSSAQRQLAADASRSAAYEPGLVMKVRLPGRPLPAAGLEAQTAEARPAQGEEGDTARSVGKHRGHRATSRGRARSMSLASSSSREAALKLNDRRKPAAGSAGRRSRGTTPGGSDRCRRP